MDFAVKGNELGSPYMAFSDTAKHRHFPLQVPLEHISTSSSKLKGRHTCVPVSIRAPGMEGWD